MFPEAIATENGILYKVKAAGIDIADYWKQKVQEEGEIELSEKGKKKAEEAILEMEQGHTKVFETLDELAKALKQ
jgi:hypothetical protein